MNKEDHFIDTDKLGDVLLEFSKKICILMSSLTGEVK